MTAPQNPVSAFTLRKQSLPTIGIKGATPRSISLLMDNDLFDRGVATCEDVDSQSDIRVKDTQLVHSQSAFFRQHSGDSNKKQHLQNHHSSMTSVSPLHTYMTQSNRTAQNKNITITPSNTTMLKF